MDLIDISEINNFWMVYLMPFSKEERNEEYVIEYQKYCIEQGIFGMGWSGNCKNNELIDLLGEKSIDSPLDEALIKKYKEIFKTEVKELEGKDTTYLYKEAYKKLNNGVETSQSSIDNFRSIKVKDLVITRLKDGNYYIGQVIQEEGKGVCFYSNQKYKDKLAELSKGESKSSGMSWCCKVDKWRLFSEQEMPEDIVGRFSQRKHSTIQNIRDDRIQMLMINIFKRNSDTELPKITLNKNNFTRALNYKELEDLVCEYILDIHKEYKLLPSKCKISKPKYEFDLINAKNIEDKYITCQVKNLEKVLYSNYEKDAHKFKKIYLFSGIGKYTDDKEKKDEDTAREEIDHNEDIKGIIEIIPKGKLFDFFKKSLTLKEIQSKKSQYYRSSLEDESLSMDEIQNKLKECGYEETKKFSQNKKQYKRYMNFIIFNQIPSECFYYNDDFKAFIKKSIPEDNKAEIEKKIKEILEITL